MDTIAFERHLTSPEGLGKIPDGAVTVTVTGGRRSLLRPAGHARIFDRCAPKDGIEPFDALVDQFMSAEPYNKAQRVVVIVDNGWAARQTLDRAPAGHLAQPVPRAHPGARWLNQAEIYFSVVQRKVLTPNDFPDLDTLEHQLLAFGRRYEQIAARFQSKFTRQHVNRLLARATPAPPERLAA